MNKHFLLSPLAFFVIFFWGISLYFSSTFAFIIPDTGVTNCYDNQGNQIVCPQPGEQFYGQDAHYGPGTIPFVNNGNGSVTEVNTGLIWEVKGAADGTVDYSNPNDADNIYTWENAQSFVDDLNARNHAGRSDWRLPTAEELGTILDLSKDQPGPIIDTNFFVNCKAGSYWTADAYAADFNKAWVIDFSSAGDDFLDKSNSFYVRAVRGGQ